MQKININMKRFAMVNRGDTVTIQDVAKISGRNVDTTSIAMTELFTVPREGSRQIVIKAEDLHQVISNSIEEDIDISFLGQNVKTVLEVRPEEKKWVKKIVTALVCIFLFFGSGLAIMNFHADVDMPRVQEELYYLITGDRTERPLLLQIPYSIGVGFGVAIFFNHIFKKKFNKEPSPLEVELYLYDENVKDFVKNEEEKGNGKGEGDHSDT